MVRCPFERLHDLDRHGIRKHAGYDGRAEIVTRLQVGDSVVVAALKGLTGDVLRTAPWPAMVSDFAKSSTRIHLSISYLDGKHPSVVTQTGLYENERFTTYDARLRKLWEFNSLAETNGSGGHKIEVADVDGDGCQEAFNGTTCLNPDGTVRWSIYRALRWKRHRSPGGRPTRVPAANRSPDDRRSLRRFP